MLKRFVCGLCCAMATHSVSEAQPNNCSDEESSEYSYCSEYLGDNGATTTPISNPDSNASIGKGYLVWL